MRRLELLHRVPGRLAGRFGCAQGRLPHWVVHALGLVQTLRIRLFRQKWLRWDWVGWDLPGAGVSPLRATKSMLLAVPSNNADRI